MDLLSLFRRAEPEQAPRGKRARASAEQAVQQLRQRARRRLIGAAVLVGLGLVAFPVVFETQPRPVPMDLPIVIPAKEQAATLALPAPLAAASLPAAAQRVAVEEASAPTAPTEPTERPAESPAARPESAAASQPAPQARAEPAAARASLPAAARFIVQVGAYADKASAQQARRKLEAKGMKTYAQVVKTPEGERIRVRLGPFAERAQADRAAAAAKALGLGGAVLSL